MAIVMGLDQHRAQITAEWLDTESGEISRARVSPAHREQVRRFLARFVGQRLEAALEATTGWRFVVEELRAVGAEVHLAEPADTAARRGNKKRAKTDRADARHLRELLMIGRLPESWIAPDHLLDLRAKVRLRHTLIDQRGEWQQRIQAVLYHHGFPQRHGLLTAGNRAWLQALELPDSAREQITVALAMIDALDARSAPVTRQLRLYARRQPGCRALMKHYGIGELTAVTILAELGDARRFSSSRHAVRYAGLDITVHQSDQRRAPGHLSRQGPPALRWALFEAAQGRSPTEQSRPPLLRPGRRPPGRQPRLPRPGAQPAQAQLPHPARARRRRIGARLTSFGARRALSHSDAPRPAPRMLLPPPPGGRPPKTERPQRLPRDHPINHHVTDPPHGAVADRDKPGRPRAPPPHARPRTWAADRSATSTPTTTTARLTYEARHR
jgi:transposase